MGFCNSDPSVVCPLSSSLSIPSGCSKYGHWACVSCSFSCVIWGALDQVGLCVQGLLLVAAFTVLPGYQQVLWREIELQGVTKISCNCKGGHSYIVLFCSVRK